MPHLAVLGFQPRIAQGLARREEALPGRRRGELLQPRANRSAGRYHPPVVAPATFFLSPPPLRRWLAGLCPTAAQRPIAKQKLLHAAPAVRVNPPRWLS